MRLRTSARSKLLAPTQSTVQIMRLHAAAAHALPVMLSGLYGGVPGMSAALVEDGPSETRRAQLP